MQTMTIHNNLSTTPHVVVDWQSCGDGRQARIVKGGASRSGQTGLVAQISEARDGDTFTRTAQVRLEGIPNLHPAALERNQRDPELCLKASPSLKNLHVLLRNVSNQANGVKFSGDINGRGWMVDTPEGRQCIGPFKAGYFTGSNARIEYPAGQWYDGEVDRGWRHGLGVVHYGPNDFMRCRFNDGRPTGACERQFANGNTYVGAMSDEVNGKASEQNFPQGEGTMTYASRGETYTGGWHRGQPHGRGHLKMENGSEYFGTWNHGSREGAGTAREKNGPNRPTWDGNIL